MQEDKNDVVKINEAVIEKLNITPLKVFLAICDEWGPKKNGGWVSYTNISKATGLSRHGVQYNIETLVSAGLLMKDSGGLFLPESDNGIIVRIKAPA